MVENLRNVATKIFLSNRCQLGKYITPKHFQGLPSELLFLMKFFAHILGARPLCIHQDLSYGEILAGRPGACLVTKLQKGPYIEIQNNFQNMFHFYALTVYDKRAYIDVHYGGTYRKKTPLQ